MGITLGLVTSTFTLAHHLTGISIKTISLHSHSLPLFSSVLCCSFILLNRPVGTREQGETVLAANTNKNVTLRVWIYCQLILLHKRKQDWASAELEGWALDSTALERGISTQSCHVSTTLQNCQGIGVCHMSSSGEKSLNLTSIKHRNGTMMNNAVMQNYVFRLLLFELMIS